MNGDRGDIEWQQMEPLNLAEDENISNGHIFPSVHFDRPLDEEQARLFAIECATEFDKILELIKNSYKTGDVTEAMHLSTYIYNGKFSLAELHFKNKYIPI